MCVDRDVFPEAAFIFVAFLFCTYFPVWSSFVYFYFIIVAGLGLNKFRKLFYSHKASNNSTVIIIFRLETPAAFLAHDVGLLPASLYVENWRH